MQISDDQVNEAALAGFGTDAIRLLCAGDVSTLVDRYGYALALGREPVAAIRDDLANCLAGLRATHLMRIPDAASVTAEYFQPNDIGLFALVALGNALILVACADELSRAACPWRQVQKWSC
ncbi:hypothetical protein AB4Y64_04385 [Lysobacter sp. TAF61]|uniref:hypothetical protein n=1 Tax=Lysobacter sp. TAF61 TaxID=3233072 RepID=UPI003F95F46D